MMRAMVLRTPAPVTSNPLRLEEVPRPTPEAGRLLVRVHVCAVCRTDLHVIEGELEPRRSPIIPGHQVVGSVAALGPGVRGFELGARVGVAWLNGTCASCAFCTTGRENLCDAPAFTGWTLDGGYAEYVSADANFVHPLPDAFGDLEAAPLLCAGIIGYRCLKRTQIHDFAGARLGIYGFGAAGHVAIQIARARGARVFVCTRDLERHGALAEALGAEWVGGTVVAPPVKLDAGIVFAPAGEIVPPALSHLDKGGTLVLGGIHMSDIPSFPYASIYGERSVQSVANNTRQDAREFLAEAARVGVRTHSEVFPLEAANEALSRLKHDAIRGAAVLTVRA
jgi:propanol-preferring alcohol dehydrogenase